MTRATRLVLLLLAFSPALVSALIVAHFAVEVPIWDDLERATLLQRWGNGTLDWRYVYSPHIEHRMGVPRLITLTSAALGDGSLLTEQVIIFAIVLLTALLVHGLLLRSFPGRPAAAYGLTFVANLLLFSPLQWETFLFSIQTSFVMPPFGLCLAVLALRSQLAPAAKFVLCLVAALLASNSFSHGVVLWGLVPAMVLLQRGFGTRRARLAFLGAWGVVAVAALVPHFTVDGYTNTSDFSYVEKGERGPGLQLGSLPSRLPRALAFYGAIQGSPLARTTVLDPRDVAPWAAGLLVGLFGLTGLGVLRRARDPELWDRCLPWLAIGGYAVVTCAAVGIGRSALNKWSYGLVPHYLTVSTYLMLAVVVLVAVLAADLLTRTPRPGVRRVLPRALAACLGALLAFQALQWGIGVAGMREWKSGRLQSRTAMLYLNHFEPQYLRRVAEELKDATKLVNRLNDAGYFVPPLLPDTRLCHFGVDPTVLDPADAQVTRLKLAGSALVLEGYARLPEAGRRADGVLVTGLDDAGEPMVLEHVELRGVPYAAVPASDHRHNGVQIPGVETFAGFRGKLPFARLAARETQTLQLWAVDSERMRVRPFARHVVVHTTPEGRRAALQPGAVHGNGSAQPAGCSLRDAAGLP